MPLGERIRGRIRYGLDNPFTRNIDPTLVLDCPFSEGIGNIVRDRSLFGNHGTIYGASWIGKALSFDGIDDYVSVAPHTTLNTLPTFTWLAWIYLIEVKTNSRIFGKYHRDFYVNSIPPVYGLTTGVEYDSGIHSYSCSNELVPKNAWTHAVATFDDLGDRKVRLYMNGAEVTYDTISIGVGNMLDDSSWELRLGNEVWGPRPFYGYIKEARIYNRALTAQEILNLYNEGE